MFKWVSHIYLLMASCVACLQRVCKAAVTLAAAPSRSAAAYPHVLSLSFPGS